MTFEFYHEFKDIFLVIEDNSLNISFQSYYILKKMGGGKGLLINDTPKISRKFCFYSKHHTFVH